MFFNQYRRVGTGFVPTRYFVLVLKCETEFGALNFLAWAEIYKTQDLFYSRNNPGSTRALLRLTLQCKCGPVTRPVIPTLPMGSPCLTLIPGFTLISLM